MMLVVPHSGLGAADNPPSTQQVIGGAIAAGAAQGIAVGVGTGSPLRGAAAAAGGLLVSIAPATGPAAPFVAAIGVGLTLVSQMFHGCGATCTQTSDAANQAQAEIQKWANAYWAQPVRYRSTQIAYLAAFDNVWAQLVQFCSNPQMGAAGARCVSERQRGGVAPWCDHPGHTGCDWFAMWRDPIANDPGVVDDPGASSLVQGVADQFASGSSLGLLWLGVGLLVAGVVL